jgi:hypothetical protein
MPAQQECTDPIGSGPDRMEAVTGITLGCHRMVQHAQYPAGPEVGKFLRQGRLPGGVAQLVEQGTFNP